MDCIPALSCTWNCLVMKNPIYIFLQTLLLMVALHNAWPVLEPSVFVWALARKHPWCFHSHSKTVLLTFTSAFMWPILRKPQRPQHGHKSVAQDRCRGNHWDLKPHKEQNMAKMLCNLNQLRPVILVPVFSLLGDCRFLSANSVLLDAALKCNFQECFHLSSCLSSSSGTIMKALIYLDKCSHENQ